MSFKFVVLLEFLGSAIERELPPVQKALPLVLDCAVSYGAWSPRPVTGLEAAADAAKWLVPPQAPPTWLR